MEINFDIDPTAAAKQRAIRLDKLLKLDPDTALDDKIMWQKLSSDVQVGVTNSNTQAEFNKRIYCFIYYMTLNNTPVTLYRLNRMFSLGSKFRVSDSVMDMAGEDLLQTFKRKAQTVILPSKYLEWLDGVYSDDPAGKAEIIDSLIARAV